MTVFSTKEFARFARKAGLAGDALLVAADEVASGRYEGSLGGGVFKKRIARRGQGKSGGFRTIVLFELEQHCFFAHGFAKNEKANVSNAELKALKRLARLLLGYSEGELNVALGAGELIEVKGDGG